MTLTIPGPVAPADEFDAYFDAELCNACNATLHQYCARAHSTADQPCNCDCVEPEQKAA